MIARVKHKVNLVVQAQSELILIFRAETVEIVRLTLLVLPGGIIRSVL
jgi:hypothetical protein